MDVQAIKKDGPKIINMRRAHNVRYWRGSLFVFGPGSPFEGPNTLLYLSFELRSLDLLLLFPSCSLSGSGEPPSILSYFHCSSNTGLRQETFPSLTTLRYTSVFLAGPDFNGSDIDTLLPCKSGRCDFSCS